MIWAVVVLGGTDVGFAEACTNAHSGVCVVMCQTAAGSKQSNAIVAIAAWRCGTLSKYFHGPRGLRRAVAGQREAGQSGK